MEVAPDQYPMEVAPDQYPMEVAPKRNNNIPNTCIPTIPTII